MSKNLDICEQKIDKAIAEFVKEPDAEFSTLITILIRTLAATSLTLAKKENIENPVKMAEGIAKGVMLSIITMAMGYRDNPEFNKLMQETEE